MAKHSYKMQDLNNLIKNFDKNIKNTIHRKYVVYNGENCKSLRVAYSFKVTVLLEKIIFFNLVPLGRKMLTSIQCLYYIVHYIFSLP